MNLKEITPDENKKLMEKQETQLAEYFNLSGTKEEIHSKLADIVSSGNAINNENGDLIHEWLNTYTKYVKDIERGYRF